jgi:hypothetical protein
MNVHVLVGESEGQAPRNHRAKTRSLGYRHGAQTSLRRGRHRNERVAFEEKKIISGRFRNSASLEKKTKIEWQKVEKRGENCHETLICLRLSITEGGRQALDL